ncbi:UPF0193 protein EVG1 homolog [Cloeon dipterum]|uniref:UPF0193 protein EVG1 homolog n=1 Tax=Cloeon dipterum TaxID=197152 RepID=UPI0032202B17
MEHVKSVTRKQKTPKSKDKVPTPNYSDDTRELIKAMMDECRLTMLQRKRLNEFIERGESFPPLAKYEQPSSTSRSMKPTRSVVDPKQIQVNRKRTKLKIIEMGSYERDNVKPKPGVDKACQKLKLQNIMAFGTEMTQHSDRPSLRGKSPSRKISSIDKRDRFEELIEDINDRCQFLQDVAELGQAEKYKFIMESEIAAKLAAMNVIDPTRCEEFKKQLKLPCTLRVSVKNKS